VSPALTTHFLTGLDRQLLQHADLGAVLEEPDSAPAIGAAYRRLDTNGLLSAEWFTGDLLPLTVSLTPLGRTALRASRQR